MDILSDVKLADIPWSEICLDLDHKGYAHLPNLLSASDCQKMISVYDQMDLFRKRIEMARYRFGQGEYKYFADPLPPLIAQLRKTIYEQTCNLAQKWMVDLAEDQVYPRQYQDFIQACQAQGQSWPTCLILQYQAGGYNCLHQDIYGDLFYPIQGVILLSDASQDFTGGEFVLTQQTSRAQAQVTVLTPDQGDLILFPSVQYPQPGKYKKIRTRVKHGVSPVRQGQRYSLGIICHNGQS